MKITEPDMRALERQIPGATFQWRFRNGDIEVLRIYRRRLKGRKEAYFYCKECRCEILKAGLDRRHIRGSTELWPIVNAWYRAIVLREVSGGLV